MLATMSRAQGERLSSSSISSADQSSGFFSFQNVFAAAAQAGIARNAAGRPKVNRSADRRVVIMAGSLRPLLKHDKRTRLDLVAETQSPAAACGIVRVATESKGGRLVGDAGREGAGHFGHEVRAAAIARRHAPGEMPALIAPANCRLV